MVLAGGFGTRLKSAVSNVPKPLAPVGDKVFLFYLLQSLYRQGFRNIDLSLFHDAQKIIFWVEALEKPADLKLRYAVEPSPLGTAGAIAFCRDFFAYADNLFICNGDTFLSAGASNLLENPSDLNLIGLVEVGDISRYGAVETADDGTILKFSEKSEQKQKGWINSGLYLLRPSLLRSLKPKSSSLEKDFFTQLAAQKQLKGERLQSLFIDIGLPEDYSRFVQMVQNKEVIESW